jgi:eukaryotic-like serine/threonine-protein kinase
LWTVASHESTGEQGGEPVGSESLLADRYRLIEQIGVGGMAVVYLAEDEVLMRKVAIKRLSPDSPRDATRRFVREAKIGAALNHPNLVTIFDAIPGGRDVLIVMEYVDGLDLGEALKRGPLRPAEAMSVLDDIAAALDHAHGAGIVHRDVKPSNVLLAPDGAAKLTDLGIARALAETATTSSELVIGSAPYMSPEQLAGRRVGPPADIYALALSAFEILSGERARHGTPVQIKHQALEQPPPDLRELRPEIPAAAAEALKHGMAGEPGRRPATASALIRDLGQALGERGDRARVAALVAAPMAARTQPFEVAEVTGGEPAVDAEPPPSAPLPVPGRRSFPWRAVLALGAIVGVIAAAVVIATGGEDGGEPSAVQGAQADGSDSGGAGGGESGGGGGGAATEAASGSPERAIQDFYELAAADDFEAAAASGTSNLSAQLGDLGSVFATLESIEFTSLETVSETADSAQLEFATVATHTDRTENCTGTATAVASGGEWLVDSIDGVSCETTG